MTSVVAPATVTVGQTAVITVYGTNPCGLVFIGWGDGVGWHHPISQLPYSYGYAWAAPGTYTITATGGGNCAGQATTTITVTGVEPEPELHENEPEENDSRGPAHRPPVRPPSLHT